MQKIIINKRLILFCVIIIITQILGYSQGFNSEKNAFINFVKRIYENEQCEGLKVISDYDRKYLVVYVTLEHNGNNSPNTMYRIAKIKATREIASYSTGSIIMSENDVNFHTFENKERIKEKTSSFVNGIELLAKLIDEKKSVFIFCKEHK